MRAGHNPAKQIIVRVWMINQIGCHLSADVHKQYICPLEDQII